MARRSSLRASIARWLAPELVRRFDAAGGGRRWESRPHFGAANAEALAGAPQIRPRARHAVANNAWAANAASVYETALVGAGIESKSAHPDQVTRALIGATFKAWTARADADALTDYFGIQAAVARAWFTDGESFIHIINTPDGPKLRILPAEMIDENKTSPSTIGECDIAGIRFAADGSRLGYWVFRERPQDTLNGLTESVLIPATDILHIFKPIGPGATRGVPQLAPVLLALRETDEWADAQLTTSKVQAMMSAFLVDQNGTGQPFEGQDPANLSMEPATIVRLPAGYDVKFSTPQQMTASMEFGSFMLRAIAAGLQIPEHRLSNDMRGVNYSSARTAEVAFRQRIEQLQFQMLAPQVLRPVFERVVTWAVLSGRIEAPDFESNPSAWLSCDVYPPAALWVDPLKDAQAQREMVDAGFMSRRQVVASLGFDVEQVDEERAADAQREQALGLQSAPAEQSEQEPEDEAQ